MGGPRGGRFPEFLSQPPPPGSMESHSGSGRPPGPPVRGGVPAAPGGNNCGTPDVTWRPPSPLRHGPRRPPSFPSPFSGRPWLMDWSPSATGFFIPAFPGGPDHPGCEAGPGGVAATVRHPGPPGPPLGFRSSCLAERRFRKCVPGRRSSGGGPPVESPNLLHPVCVRGAPGYVRERSFLPSGSGASSPADLGAIIRVALGLLPSQLRSAGPVLGVQWGVSRVQVQPPRARAPFVMPPLARRGALQCPPEGPKPSRKRASMPSALYCSRPSPPAPAATPGTWRVRAFASRGHGPIGRRSAEKGGAPGRRSRPPDRPTEGPRSPCRAGESPPGVLQPCGRAGPRRQVAVPGRPTLCPAPGWELVDGQAAGSMGIYSFPLHFG